MENPLNKVSQLGDVISRGVSYASGKKEQLARQIINGILLFIILIVFGCLDFATLKFHPEYLVSLSFWGVVLSKTIAGICAFNIGINLLWDLEIAKNFILAFAIARYEKLKKWADDEDFEYFVTNIFNFKEKKKAYIASINKQIYFLNRVNKAKDRLLYSKKIPDDAPNKEELERKLNEERAKNKYCIKRARLEELKSEEFIKDNLDGIYVRYLEVRPEVFKLEIDGSRAIGGVKTVGNVTLGKAKATSSMVFGMIGFSAFVTAFALELDQEEFASNMEAFLHYLLKCAEDVAIVIWQSLRGALKTKKIISSELTQPYDGRNTVLLDFLKYKRDKGDIIQDEYKNIIEELNSIVIEGRKPEQITYKEEEPLLEGGN